MPKSYFHGATLDDLMREVFGELTRHGQQIKASKGNNIELTSVLLELENPRARLSRTETRGKPFGCLGELCWYLAKTNNQDFITYYLKKYEEYGEEGVIFGGYGPRLFDWKDENQFSNVRELLKKKPHSRRAVIQLFDAKDLAKDHADIPCTCSLQFLIRKGKLDLHVSMRSNDAFVGLAHDVFCFSMLQEIMARDLSVEIGRYAHVAGSLHLYDSNRAAVNEFLEEGWQSTTSPMPPMPEGDPWPSIGKLLEAEQNIRETGDIPKALLKQVDPYWADLTRLLLIFRFAKNKDTLAIKRTLAKMSSGIFNPYIEKKASE